MKTTSYIQVQNNQGLSFWIETDSLSEPPGKIDQNSSVKEDSNTTQFAEREEPVSSYADREQPVSLSLKRLFTPEIKKVLTLDGFQEKLNSLIKGIANLPNDLPSETKQVEIEIALKLTYDSDFILVNAGGEAAIKLKLVLEPSNKTNNPTSSDKE